MAKQTIGIGSAPNDGTGDTIRDAFDKANDNFTELYDDYLPIAYKGAPQMSDQDDYTLVLGDAGKHYYHISASTHTLTIPANSSVAFPIGTVIGIVNEDGGGDLSIAITSDTLRWTDQTGTRTLGENGTASLLKVASTVWRLTGDEIT